MTSARLSAALLLVLSLAASSLGQPAPEVYSRGVILVDARTGVVLWEKDADVQRPMASTTKIMTGLLAIESRRLDEWVEVSDRAARVGEASLRLRAGDSVPLRDLVNGLLVRSGNDAAVAIAEHIDGSVEAFVTRMNERAKELGAENTNFVNPHGLHHAEQYSTPRDLAIIAQAAMQNPEFEAVVRQPSYMLPPMGERPEREVTATFRWFLQGYPGAEGIKTGTTRQAGRTFVASAHREGWRLIAVLLNSPDLRQDTTRLFDWGFEHYRGEVIAAGQEVGLAPVQGGREPYVRVAAVRPVALTAKSTAVPTQPAVADLELVAPVREGQNLGIFPLLAGEDIVGEIELVAVEEVGMSILRIAMRVLLALLILGMVIFVGAKATKNSVRRGDSVAARGGADDPRRPRKRKRPPRRPGGQG
jgi:serine-type D-Ala-D-Ala carboxypeptidase (penicillin-binding protein 5/6)